jgi:hypothetical protein
LILLVAEDLVARRALKHASRPAAHYEPLTHGQQIVEERHIGVPHGQELSHRIAPCAPPTHSLRIARRQNFDSQNKRKKLKKPRRTTPDGAEGYIQSV